MSGFLWIQTYHVLNLSANDASSPISVGGQLLRLVREVPSRPPGYFAECYRDSEDAAFEERVCQDWKTLLEA